MRTKRMMVGAGALAVGLLVVNLMSSPVYGQARNTDTQAMAAFTFGLLSPRLLNALNPTPDQLAKAAAIRQQLLEIQDEVRGLFNENQ